MFRYAEGACSEDSEALHIPELVERRGCHRTLCGPTLVQRFLFPVFAQQHNAILLVAVPILQARQGKGRQGKARQDNPSTLLHEYA